MKNNVNRSLTLIAWHFTSWLIAIYAVLCFADDTIVLIIINVHPGGVFRNFSREGGGMAHIFLYEQETLLDVLEFFVPKIPSKLKKFSVELGTSLDMPLVHPIDGWWSCTKNNMKVMKNYVNKSVIEFLFNFH